jgi:hypothetical protein
LPAALARNKLFSAGKEREKVLRLRGSCGSGISHSARKARKELKQAGENRVNQSQQSTGFRTRRLWLCAALLGLLAAGGLKAQTSSGKIGDITGDYHFLEPNDTLALLQEEGTLKGYIDVLQGQSESDVVLSYPIVIGSRKGDHVEFRTRRIHEMYYRFSGTAQRGTGRKKNDPDYLQLTGELQIITRQPETNKETIDRRQVVFKSKGESQEQP